MNTGFWGNGNYLIFISVWNWNSTWIELFKRSLLSSPLLKMLGLLKQPGFIVYQEGNYNHINTSTDLIQNAYKTILPFPISSQRLLSSNVRKKNTYISSFQKKRSSEIAFCLARVPCHAALLKWPPGIGWLIEFVSSRQTPLHFVSNPISVHLPGHWKKLPRSAHVIRKIPHKSLLPFHPHGGKW